MLTSLMKNRFGAGLLAGLVAGLAMLGLRPLLDAPTLQELIAEQFLLLISAELFSFILQQVSTLGKIMSIIGVTLMLALAGGPDQRRCIRLGEAASAVLGFFKAVPGGDGPGVDVVAAL